MNIVDSTKRLVNDARDQWFRSDEDKIKLIDTIAQASILMQCATSCAFLAERLKNLEQGIINGGPENKHLKESSQQTFAMFGKRSVAEYLRASKSMAYVPESLYILEAYNKSTKKHYHLFIEMYRRLWWGGVIPEAATEYEATMAGMVSSHLTSEFQFYQVEQKRDKFDGLASTSGKIILGALLGQSTKILSILHEILFFFREAVHGHH